MNHRPGGPRGYSAAIADVYVLWTRSEEVVAHKVAEVAPGAQASAQD